MKRRVLLLEQHNAPGGLTQTFRRNGWVFAPGVHYIGGVGPQPGAQGQFGRLLAWLSDGALKFAPCANPYDIVRAPGLEFGIPHPESAYCDALMARFPKDKSAIRSWFLACDEARTSAYALFALHSMPAWLAWGLRQWHGSDVEHWTQHTLAEELARIENPALWAILGARWADYGAPPAQAPFAEHALVTGSYNAGAYYPVGGPARFAQTLLPVIEAAGGELRLGCDVKHILTGAGRVSGVDFELGGARHHEQTGHLVSAMGVANTVAAWIPARRHCGNKPSVACRLACPTCRSSSAWKEMSKLPAPAAPTTGFMRILTLAVCGENRRMRTRPASSCRSHR